MNLNRKNIWKVIGILAIFVIFGYFSYQDQMAQKQMEIDSYRNVPPPQRHSGSFPYVSTPEEEQKMHERLDALNRRQREESGENSNQESNSIDVFNDNLEDYLSDPEDEITYPPEIYEDQMDEEERDIIENELDY